MLNARFVCWRLSQPVCTQGALDRLQRKSPRAVSLTAQSPEMISTPPSIIPTAGRLAHARGLAHGSLCCRPYGCTSLSGPSAPRGAATFVPGAGVDPRGGPGGRLRPGIRRDGRPARPAAQRPRAQPPPALPQRRRRHDTRRPLSAAVALPSDPAPSSGLAGRPAPRPYWAAARPIGEQPGGGARHWSPTAAEPRQCGHASRGAGGVGAGQGHPARGARRGARQGTAPRPLTPPPARDPSPPRPRP